MKFTSVVTPFTDENLKLVSQVGVTHVTIRYPGPGLDELAAVKKRVQGFGLDIAAIEGYLPIENIKLGNELFEQDVEEMKLLLSNMEQVGIPVACYNFMAGTDWVRTKLDIPERGGAWVTGFNLAEAEKAVSLRDDVEEIGAQTISAEELWANLERFLKEILPTAERHGIVLAMHPDDPPLMEFMGKARIMNSVESFERLVKLVESPSNAICFCQGTFAEMGVDIPAAIRKLGEHIRYVHYRDIRGTADNFVETFHDNGITNMYAAMKAYREIGYDGPIRPDHVPQLVGEEEGSPGYTMLGRLYAFGYMRGLLQAADQELAKSRT